MVKVVLPAPTAPKKMTFFSDLEIKSILSYTLLAWSKFILPVSNKTFWPVIHIISLVHISLIVVSFSSSFSTRSPSFFFKNFSFFKERGSFSLNSSKYESGLNFPFNDSLKSLNLELSALPCLIIISLPM